MWEIEVCVLKYKFPSWRLTEAADPEPCRACVVRPPAALGTLSTAIFTISHNEKTKIF